MELLPSPSPEELAREARQALQKQPPKEGRDLYIELVRKGFINARWQVTKLIGGSAEPEPNYETWTPERSATEDGCEPTHHGIQARR
jgi:hypothetical protein